MKTMKTTDSHNECPNCGGLPIDPRSVNVDADMLFHNNEPVFTYAGEQQQDWRFQRELDAEPETTSTCFDCGHRSQRPMTIETTEGTAQVGEPDDAVTDHLLSGGDDELPPELRTAAEVASTGSKGGSKGRRLCGRI
jgi:hypothetical protein